MRFPWFKKKAKPKSDMDACLEAKLKATQRKLEVADRAIELLEKLNLDRRTGTQSVYTGPDRRVAVD